MSKHEFRGNQWDVIGTYSEKDGLTKASKDSEGEIIPFTDKEIRQADQVRVEFTLPNGSNNWVTFHNDADWGWDALEDYVEDWVADNGPGSL